MMGMFEDEDKQDTKPDTEWGEYDAYVTNFPIPLKDGITFWAPDIGDIRRWGLVYPLVDIYQQLRECSEWNKANPGKRKTKGGIYKHVVMWLGKAQKQEREINAKAKAKAAYTSAARVTPVTVTFGRED